MNLVMNKTLDRVIIYNLLWVHVSSILEFNYWKILTVRSLKYFKFNTPIWSDSIFMRVYFHPVENNFLIKFFEYLAGIDNNHHKKVFHFQLLTSFALFCPSFGKKIMNVFSFYYYLLFLNKFWRGSVVRKIV